MKRAMCSALVCGFLLAGSAWSADKEEQAIRTTILKSAEGWSSLNPDNNDAIYTSDSHAVFFDVAPMQYTGWSNYKDGFRKAFGGFQDAKVTINDDLQAHHSGNLGWGTTTWKLVAHTKDGKEMQLEGRATLVLEKQKGKWVIVHEHYSVPAQM